MDILGLGPPSVCVATPLAPNTQVLEPPLVQQIGKSLWRKGLRKGRPKFLGWSNIEE